MTEILPAILHRLHIKAMPARVFEAISTQEGIQKWWTHDTVFESKIGGLGAFGFYNRRFFPQVRISALKAPSHMVWDVVSEVWSGKTITFDLVPENDGVSLTFAHQGFGDADVFYPSANTRWGYYLISLKSYLEKGAGTPHPHDIEL